MPETGFVHAKITKRRLSPMIRHHEIMLEMLRNPALPGTLQQLIDDGGTRKKWAANALVSAGESGFVFPENTEVVLQQFRKGWQVEVRVYEEPYTYIVGFDSVKGFYYK